MSRVSPQQPLLPSVLDRLIDHEPDVSTEPAWKHAQTLREYEMSVLRDVEALLNSRQVVDVPAGSAELLPSVLSYGLPDFSSAGIGSLEEREVLRRSVLDAIRHFEPRLRDVHVELHQPNNQFDRSLRMTVHAMLKVDPDPVAITFDTIVQPSSGVCKVEAK